MNQPQARFEEISPILAAQLLRGMGHNRKENPKVTARYADDMVVGRWHDTGQPIIIDLSGSLIDGQHRLRAVIQSETTQTFLVVRGTAPERILQVDDGRKRSFSDYLAITKVPNSKNVAAITSLLYRIESGNGSVRNGNTHASNTLLHSVFQSNRFEILEAASFMAAKSRVTRMLNTFCGVLRLLTKRSDPELSDEFFGALNRGIGLEAHNPVFVLREALIADMEERNPDKRLTPLMKRAIAIKAWNAFKSGREVKRLTWRGYGANKEAFPDVA